MPAEITVEELKSKIDNNDTFILVDCREENEHKFCSIAGAKLIPLSQFEDRAESELAKDAAIVIHCHHGGRSMRACHYLEDLGYTNVTNLKGGIDQWSIKVDSKVPRY
jgi:rhodanese-related sulfurtransferase